jgi:hypothetical protein
MSLIDIAVNTNSNWQMYGVIAQFLVALIALFVALFGALIADLVHRNFLAPKLTIKFDEHDLGLCHKTLICAEKIGCKPDYYFRFYVENIGKSMAKNCEIVAEKLWHRTPKGQDYLPYNQFAPMNLKWTGRKGNKININPKRRVIGNIGHIPQEKYQEYLKEQNNLIDLIGNEEGTKLRFILELTQSFFALPNCLAKGEYSMDRRMGK